MSTENAPAPRRTAGPMEALSDLLAGNRRFVGGRPRHGHHVSAAAAAASGDQQPYAVVIGCIDSRVPLEAIFDQTFGSICVVRSGAHVLDLAVRGSVEFALGQLRVPLVVVLGHQRCGAVGLTIEALRAGQRPDGALAYLFDQIAPAVLDVGLDAEDLQSRAVRRHVERTVEQLGTFAVPGQVDIVGAVYDLDSGKVALLD
ncbi:carbonic anhydrase [Polymorphospora rubra]|uniref:carbonic anhydrase n=1 Tax=Polymorphospora rubra TaxID=338584 RepID=UPI0033E02CDA